MKKLLLFTIITTLLAGCAETSYSYRQAHQKIYYTDYTRYVNSGILVSSSSDFTGYPYVSLGNITVQYEESSIQTDTSIVSFDDMTTQNMLDRLVLSAKMYGANGVINVKITYHPAAHRQSYWLATAETVFFDPLPPMPTFTQPAAQPSTPSRKEFALRTVDYLLQNNMSFLQWNSSGENI
ncbi:MAG: hypothetical protein K2O55_07770, partial [Alistipes sp.]|nr:hypothetical protein [Alistipes sp.]